MALAFRAVLSDDLPAWPVIYSSCISVSFLLLSGIRLWQLHWASIKVKYVGIYHIKVVCTC
jgi:hypothetical protein